MDPAWRSAGGRGTAKRSIHGIGRSVDAGARRGGVPITGRAGWTGDPAPRIPRARRPRRPDARGGAQPRARPAPRDRAARHRARQLRLLHRRSHDRSARPPDGRHRARPCRRRARGHARRQPRVPAVHDALRLRLRGDPQAPGGSGRRRAARPRAAPPPELVAHGVRRAARGAAVRGRHPAVVRDPRARPRRPVPRERPRLPRARVGARDRVPRRRGGGRPRGDDGSGSLLGGDGTFIGDLASRAVRSRRCSSRHP